MSVGDQLPSAALEAARQWAAKQDAADELKSYRTQFHIPSRADLESTTLADEGPQSTTSEPCIYLCGNSLGVQPKATNDYIQAFLTQWRRKAVMGHFAGYEDSPLPSFVDVDDHAAKLMAPIVGAENHEVAVMGALTGNLHLLMSAFYRPNKAGDGRYKYAIESQIKLAGFEPREAMILVEPQEVSDPLLTTKEILEVIDREKDSLALVLLPGIQFYTGQYFDIKTITAHAQLHGIVVGWDCAHAAGNVDLQLHEWNVDFAVWCTYKYLNSGPGSMAGIFVHDKHGRVERIGDVLSFRPRLAGWWGNDKASRFQMRNDFVPRSGAAGFQVSNPSALDLSAVIASLTIFKQAGMARLRRKSIEMTKFLEVLLTEPEYAGHNPPYKIITPKDPAARGAQLSIRLNPELLEKVLQVFQDNHVVIDERKPDVIRVAPAPLYNSFTDVFAFCEIFRKALAVA